MTTPKLGFLALAALLVALGYPAWAAPPPPQGYAAPQPPPARVPILYEAYYPEPREWSPRASLKEIEKLSELTRQLLREEEQLRQLAAAASSSTPENIFEPRGQVLEYVFSRPAENDVQVTSLTVSDVGQRQQQHRARHHHDSPNWLLRRLAPS